LRHRSDEKKHGREQGSKTRGGERHKREGGGDVRSIPQGNRTCHGRIADKTRSASSMIKKFKVDACRAGRLRTLYVPRQGLQKLCALPGGRLETRASTTELPAGGHARSHSCMATLFLLACRLPLSAFHWQNCGVCPMLPLSPWIAAPASLSWNSASPSCSG
jgi:hypothetical protein